MPIHLLLYIIYIMRTPVGEADDGGYSPRMEEDRPTFTEWVVTGLGLGIGLGLASMIFAAVSWAAWTVYLDYELKNLPTPVRYENVTRRVPPRSRDECLAVTGGVGNEHYNRCRKGYSYTERVRVQ
jgi:hypothetical protein